MTLAIVMAEIDDGSGTGGTEVDGELIAVADRKECELVVPHSVVGVLGVRETRVDPFQIPVVRLTGVPQLRAVSGHMLG
jgi:hypothetical protein